MDLHDMSVAEHVKVPPQIRELINMANSDLYFGPLDGEPGYIGFSNAIQAIRDWADELDTLYVQEWSGCVSLTEPEGEYDGDEYIDPLEYYVYERKDILRVILGRELISYI